MGCQNAKPEQSNMDLEATNPPPKVEVTEVVSKSLKY